MAYVYGMRRVPLHSLTCPLHNFILQVATSHGSAVIVAGGITCYDHINPWTITRTVEALQQTT